MPNISSDDAVSLAKKYGLGLPDALALQAMSRDVDEAEHLAQIISTPTDKAMDNALRQAVEKSTPKKTYGA